MLIYFATLIAGFTILVFAADRFVMGTAAIAHNLGIPPLIIGLTIVGFGTSAPEILISVIAAIDGKPELAIGNAIGSNIANIGLILGITAIISPITVHSDTLKREMPILLFTVIACYILLSIGGFSQFDGIVMLIGLGFFLYWLVNTALANRTTDPLNQEIEQEIPSDLSTLEACIWTLLGLVALLASSKLLVWAAVNIALLFGVSELVIGLTIVALGTSLPELAASIASILKNEDDLAIGNVLGSNMYNLLAVLAIPGIIGAGPIDAEVLKRDFPWMIGFTVALIVFAYSYKQTGNINRLEGGFLVSAYIGYQALLFFGSI